MSKKNALSTVTFLILANVLVAQESDWPRGPLHGGTDAWLADLDRTRQSNDRGQMGESIEDVRAMNSARVPRMGKPVGSPRGFGGPGAPMGAGRAAADSEFFPNGSIARNHTKGWVIPDLDDFERILRVSWIMLAGAWILWIRFYRSTYVRPQLREGSEQIQVVKH